jgi:hypothetical protein
LPPAFGHALTAAGGTHQVADPVCPSNLGNHHIDPLIHQLLPSRQHRTDERTEELLEEIEWPAHAQLPDWHQVPGSPPQGKVAKSDEASGAKESKRLPACVAEDKLVASIYPTTFRRPAEAGRPRQRP